jgi:hypothetical protein
LSLKVTRGFVLGGRCCLEEAVDLLETYERLRPHHFDRRKLNRRLKQYAQGDEEWLWQQMKAA